MLRKFYETKMITILKFCVFSLSRLHFYEPRGDGFVQSDKN